MSEESTSAMVGPRTEITGARRLVVKVGSSSLTDASGALDMMRLEVLVDALAAARLRGQDVVLVSSGAMASGMGTAAHEAASA